MHGTVTTLAGQTWERWLTNELLVSRVLEQVTQWTAWDRRAWQPGTVLCLREFVEAAQWAEQGVLSGATVQWLRADLRRSMGVDSALGRLAFRSQVDEILQKNFTYSSQARRRLERLADALSAEYLDEWCRVASTGSFNVERASRLISAHLIDAGFHPEYLRLVVTDLLDATIPEFLDSVTQVIKTGMTTFEGWVLLKSVPETQLMQANSAWMSPTEVSKAMRSIGAHAPREQSGALRFTVEARDKYSAAAEVRERIERLVNRTRFLRTTDRLSYAPTLWLNTGDRVRLSVRGPAISAMSLAKSGILYVEDRGAVSALRRIDDSFELASHLISSPAPVAVTNSWAALESLLIDASEADRDAGGRVVAASRAADVVAAAWTRAELTRLSHRIAANETNFPLLDRALATAGSDNAARCRALLAHWDPVKLRLGLSNVDIAAVNRISALIDNPKATLKRVQQYMHGSFRRLYRQRNIVMHGGELKPVAAQATTRTAGPLVGALLDRLSTAAQLQDVEPLAAAAQAEMALRLAAETGRLDHLLSV